MRSYNIAVIPGDGTGPEVTREALKVCEAAAGKFKFKLHWHPYDFGGERYLKTGEVLPDSAVAELRRVSAAWPHRQTRIISMVMNSAAAGIPSP